jgi:hypothetical protein
MIGSPKQPEAPNLYEAYSVIVPASFKHRQNVGLSIHLVTGPTGPGNFFCLMLVINRRLGDTFDESEPVVPWTMLSVQTDDDATRAKGNTSLFNSVCG